jgi:hypothetical protein
MTRIVPTIPLAMAKALLIARRATLSNLHCAMKGVLRTSARKGATSCETPRALDKHLAAIRDEIAHPGYCHGGTSLSSAQHFIRKRRPRCIGTWSAGDIGPSVGQERRSSSVFSLVADLINIRETLKGVEAYCRLRDFAKEATWC